MNKQRIVRIAAIAFLAASGAAAQTVYKSVDAQGRITYSEEPPQQADPLTVEEVKIAPGPTEEQRMEAMRRAQQIEATTRAAAEARDIESKEQQGDLADAQEKLRRAELELEEAKIQSDDDWQYLATGGRVLKQSYLDRVRNAERKVQEAQDAAQTAKRGTK